MSKIQQPQQPQHSQPSQDIEEQGPELVQSNGHEMEQAGLSEGGVAPSEMGLEGSFAGFVLDCMPMMAALPLARRFASNPAVIEWASTFSVADVLQSLGEASTVLLQQLWPVGIGFDAEGQVAGKLAGGVDVMAQASALRSADNQLDLGVSYQASVGVDGAGAGVELVDAFGEKAAGAMAKAGIKVSAAVNARQSTSFDLMAIVQSSKNLAEQSISDLLVHPLAPAQFILPDEWIRRMDYMCMDDWDIDRSLMMEQGASFTMGQLDPSKHTGLVSELMSFDPLGMRAQNVMPFLESGLCSQLGVHFEGNDWMLLKGTLSGMASIEELVSLPGMEPLNDGVALSRIAQQTGAGASSAVVLAIDLTQSEWKDAVDFQRSGVEVSNTVDAEGMMTTDSAFFSFASMLSAQEPDVSIDEKQDVVCPDLCRSVSLDLDPAMATEHCPDLVNQVLGVTGMVYDSQTVLQLVGKMELKSAVVAPLIDELFTGPNALVGVSIGDVFHAAMVRVTAPDQPGPRWVEQCGPIMDQIVASIEFSGARIVGHVHQGSGGGAELSVGTSAEFTGRMEAGAMIDLPVSADDAARLNLAMTRKSSAA